MHQLRFKWLALVAVAAIASLALAACGGGGDSSESSSSESGGSSTTASGGGEGGCTADGPIEVGGVAGLTGTIPVPEAAEAAEAYFAQVNDEGGVCGQQIDYKVLDDKSDPQASATAARSLVTKEGVDVLLSESFVDCTVNGAFYEQEEISVTGVAADNKCFNLPNVSMTNSGPGIGILGGLYLASEELHKDKVCAVILSLPGTEEYFKHAVTVWEEQSGRKITLYDDTLQPTADPTPYVLKVKEAGCEAVVTINPAPVMSAWLKAMEAQGVKNVITFGPAPIFDPAFAKAVPKNAEGMLYVAPEFDPGIDNPEVSATLKAIEEHGAKTVNNTSLGGWVAAEALVATIESIEGEVSRDSINEAFKGLTSFPNPYMGTPFAFGPGDAHVSNTALKFTVAEKGKWNLVNNEWLEIPGAAEAYAIGG